jgi:hypothetical protein
MPEMAAATAARLFLAHEQALEHAAAKIDQFLTQEARLTSAECFVVCLRAAAKFLARYDKNEWRDIIKHAPELLLQHAALYQQSGGDNSYAKQKLPAQRLWRPWRRG